jgi:hypothetical protein
MEVRGMAELRNDSGALRFAVELVSREAPPDAPPGAAAGEPFILGAAGLEYLDRRDGEWWPFVRLPVLHVRMRAVEGLASQLTEFLRGGSTGFAWRSGDDAPAGLQLGAVPGGAVAEVGLDLGAFLAESAGAPRRPETELALFRFRCTQADLVRFSDALNRELEELRR